MIGRAVLALTFASALGSGLVAGIFFAFSTFVMAALARLQPAEGIAAMQSINVTVINPIFFAAFLGTAGLCVILAVMALARWGEPGAIPLLCGSVLYLVGVLLVTGIFNVPMNDALAAAVPHSPEGAALWTRYLADWTAWNHVRTIAPLLASAAFIAALCLQFEALGSD